MGTRFLASIVAFIVVSADKADMEPAHANAPPRLCLLQTKTVRSVSDAAHSHEEGIASPSDVDVDEESREQDDDTQEMSSIEDVAKWYEGDDAAAENWLVDGIVELQELQEEFDPEDPCRSGMVGRMRAQGPECFDACPQMCEPLAEAVTAFFRRGGVPAVRRVICRHKESFYCPLLEANQEKCEPFVTRARRMRITLPDSIPALQDQCQR